MMQKSNKIIRIGYVCFVVYFISDDFKILNVYIDIVFVES